MTRSDFEVEGVVDPAFSAVRSAFVENFASRGDVGAAFCVYVDGQEVVNLWGGRTAVESGEPWGPDTLSVIFSATKGVSSISLLALIEEGLLELDAPVASYWPEFAASGKEAITIRHVLAHQSGLPCIEARLSTEELLEGRAPVRCLASQEPLWEPGTASGYHGFTFGWLVGEIVQRVCGKSLGRVLAEDIGPRLGLDTWIGLPAEEHARVATLMDGGDQQTQAPSAEMLALNAKRFAEGSLLMRTMLFGSGLTAGPQFTAPEILAAELPAANGVSTARSLARLYASTVGSVDGVRLVGPELLADATAIQTDAVDKVMDVRMVYMSGFTPVRTPATWGSSSFGFGGTGGSMGLAHAGARLAAAYVTNSMQRHGGEDPRRMVLMDAVYSALGTSTPDPNFGHRDA